MAGRCADMDREGSEAARRWFERHRVARSGEGEVQPRSAVSAIGAVFDAVFDAGKRRVESLPAAREEHAAMVAKWAERRDLKVALEEAEVFDCGRTAVAVFVRGAGEMRYSHGVCKGMQALRFRAGRVSRRAGEDMQCG